MNNTNFASKMLKGRGFSSAPLMNNYNKSVKTKEEQNGRSMIEMLGVLAIIGVLSVGGIAGYSKAIMRYRTNKTIEQISLISSNIKTFFSSQKYLSLYCSCFRDDCGSASFNSGCAIIKKAKLVPDEMLTIDSSGKIRAMTNAFGGEFLIEHTNSNGSSYGLALRGLPSEACIEIATQDWNSITSSGYAAMGIDKLGTFIKEGNIWDLADYLTSSSCSYLIGNTSMACMGSRNTFSLEDAVTACSCSGDNCAIELVFKK